MSSLVVILFFAFHAKKRTKTRLTGRAGKNHHGYQPSPGFIAQPHANYSQPVSGSHYPWTSPHLPRMPVS
jgi:hypothetical protein